MKKITITRRALDMLALHSDSGLVSDVEPVGPDTVRVEFDDEVLGMLDALAHGLPGTEVERYSAAIINLCTHGVGRA